VTYDKSISLPRPGLLRQRDLHGTEVAIQDDPGLLGKTCPRTLPRNPSRAEILTSTSTWGENRLSLFVSISRISTAGVRATLRPHSRPIPSSSISS
jgi:hypothetical protein